MPIPTPIAAVPKAIAIVAPQTTVSPSTVAAGTPNVSQGYAVVAYASAFRVANTSGLAANPVVCGVALNTAQEGEALYVATSGVVPNSVTHLGSGAASAVGVDVNGKLVRASDPSCVSGFYVGDCDAAGDFTLRYRDSVGGTEFATAPPTSGAHTVGEVVVNSSPTRIGSPGTGYFIESWRCSASGTPGAWTPVIVPLSPALRASSFAGINKTATAGFGQRDGAQLLYMSGFYYLLGGWNPTLPNAWSTTDVTTNEVWSSPDLVTWTKLLAHDANPPVSGAGARWRRRHTFGTEVIGGYLYVVGGDTTDGGPPYPSDVWRSADGITWERVAATSPWGYLSILGYFQGAIHIMGGTSSPTQHVRSVDGGVTWETLPNLPFARASVTRAVTDPNRNRMYIIGGLDDLGNRKNDCWEYDGTTWTRVSASAAWRPREWIATAYYESRLWALTGSNVNNQGGGRYSEDGGATWTELPAVPWPASHADGIYATSNGIAIASGSGLDSRAYLLKKLPDDPCVFTATLPWSLWFEGASYDVNTPKILGRSSAGLSGSHAMTVVSGGPTQGEINGRPTIVLDGVNDVLRYTSASEALDIISLTAYTICVTCKVNSSGSNSGTPYNNPGLGSDSGAWFDVGIRSNGAVEAYHDGGGVTHADSTWTAGQLVHFQVKFDGATLWIRRNGGAWTSVAKSAITGPLGTFSIGANYNLTQFAGIEICEYMASKSAISDSDLDIVYAEQSLKWGV